MKETDRILEEHRRREREIPAGFYDLDRPANLFLRQGQERALRGALERSGLLPLSGRRLLEVGCGSGNWLEILERFGARREGLAGIDLDPGRADVCRSRFPGADIRSGDASVLPWEGGSFDLVLQSTVFSSILDPGMRRAVAAEMLRVLAPGGAILWYDFFMDNPANPNVRGVRRREIESLFPGCRLELRRATLAPPLARRIVPVSWTAAAVLESLRVFDTHYLGMIRRAG
ncbi:MAG TPA: methyltransferase domain-containing protein [Thermoanaerobaculia bacterium]|jgi:ubiquinone/menaquinone biosynthesis C-methylase UbiE|nr:methyltransferase domain-containing protein [Thermoanaerobaculia bacterium]